MRYLNDFLFFLGNKTIEIMLKLKKENHFTICSDTGDVI